MTKDFIDIEKLCPGIEIDIRYATKNNFTGHVVYPLAKCFLRKATALKLCKVQKDLEKKGLGLKIWDGYRPLHVQWIFWKLVPDERYVADPKKGSKHNRGAAVDLTLVDKEGKELPMPSEFDDFSEKAVRNHPTIPHKAKANAQLLEQVMHEHGFVGYAGEWWHYDDVNWETYPIEDISLEELSK